MFDGRKGSKSWSSWKVRIFRFVFLSSLCGFWRVSFEKCLIRAFAWCCSVGTLFEVVIVTWGCVVPVDVVDDANYSI